MALDFDARGAPRAQDVAAAYGYAAGAVAEWRLFVLLGLREAQPVAS